jgi:formylglycine-generating enzyme required for sulfatase activity
MTAPVGSFTPNPWRIFDTVGNVIEWVADDYRPGYAAAPTDESAVIAEDTSRKVQRGGAWDYMARHSRSASRDYREARRLTPDAGFRLVLDPTETLLQPLNR